MGEIFWGRAEGKNTLFALKNTKKDTFFLSKKV
jgi:hypothetical protein